MSDDPEDCLHCIAKWEVPCCRHAGTRSPLTPAGWLVLVAVATVLCHIFRELTR